MGGRGMKVCKYFGMYGRCLCQSGPIYLGEITSFIDISCSYVSALGNPTERQEKCEDYEPLNNEGSNQIVLSDNEFPEVTFENSLIEITKLK